MGLPKYKKISSDIDYLIQLAEQLNPFAKEKEKELNSGKLASMYAEYNAILSDLRSLADPDEPEKDSIWDNLMASLQSVNDRFDVMSVEEINEIINNHSGLKLWEFTQLENNIKNQMNMMELHGKIIAPSDNEAEYRELSEKHNKYSELAKEFDPDFANYDSYDAFAKKLEETRIEEEKRKKEYERYFIDPNPVYINKIVEKTINGKPVQFNYEQIYDFYNTEYDKLSKLEESIQKKINDCFDDMKKQLKGKDEADVNTLNSLKDAIKTGKDSMASLTNDVLKTIDVGNIESKLSGDVQSLDEYFDTLDREIADRPIIALRQKTKNNKEYQLKRKAYLEGLRLQDKYKAGGKELTERLNALKKHAQPYGKSLDEMLERSKFAKENNLDSLSPEDTDADLALSEFEAIKEDFIKLYSVYSDNKNFQKNVRKITSPDDFLQIMTNTINHFEDEFINPILPQETKDKPLSEQEIRVKEGCTQLNANYSQMKVTREYIENCEAQIKYINEHRIDPALYDQEKAMDATTIEKYEKLGVKPNVDLKALYKQLQDIAAAKVITEKEVQQYEPLKNAYLNEKAYIQNFMTEKEKATKAYNEIKGSTAKMQAANEKAIQAWAEYKELQTKSNALKEKVFSGVASASEGNAAIYKDALSNIASELQHFLDTAKVGRDSIFKDSNEYTEMIKAVQKIFAPAKEGEKKLSLKETDPVKVKSGLDAIANATGKYLVAKKNQWRLFPSTQRVTRLTYANNLLTCVNANAAKLLAVQAEMTGIKNETSKEYARAEKELGKENINSFEDFFTEVVKPRAKAIINDGKDLTDSIQNMLGVNNEPAKENKVPQVEQQQPVKNENTLKLSL